eukprot:8744404-Karenia_brevis.AAC.1
MVSSLDVTVEHVTIECPLPVGVVYVGRRRMGILRPSPWTCPFPLEGGLVDATALQNFRAW